MTDETTPRTVADIAAAALEAKGFRVMQINAGADSPYGFFDVESPDGLVYRISLEEM